MGYLHTFLLAIDAHSTLSDFRHRFAHTGESVVFSEVSSLPGTEARRRNDYRLMRR